MVIHMKNVSSKVFSIVAQAVTKVKHHGFEILNQHVD